VLVTGAAGQIAYSLVFAVARGDMLGPEQRVILHLLDIPMCAEALKGLVMELEDCAYPLLAGVVATTDVKEAFTGVNYACLVGAMPRRQGMERKDLLIANAKIFVEQGKALNDYSDHGVKVVVVGNPANTNALIAQTSAPNLPKTSFSALTRLDHNRAKSMLAQHLNVPVTGVRHVTIWGNHSGTQYPDTFHATVLKDSAQVPIRTAIADHEWLDGAFIKNVQQRGAAVIEARKLSSAASAANAIVAHMHDWVFGTPEGDWVSMGIPSDGSYGIAEGVIYSYPVTIAAGKVSIVHGLDIDAFSRTRLDQTHAELESEKQQAFEFIHSTAQ